MLSYQQRFLVLAMLVLGTIIYWSGLTEIVSRWQQQEAYSHGYVIPFIVLYILWERLPLLRLRAARASWSGLFIISIALASLIIGELSALYLLIQYSFILFLIGLALVTVGAATRYIIVPLSMLFFVVPLPYFLEVALSAQLQLWSSVLGVEMIRAFNIPVFLEGNIIDLGGYRLQVVEACSGLNYLFPLMSLGFIIAYFYQAAFWKRLFIVLVTIPITVLMNSIRITLVGVSVNYGGISLAEGILHDFEGWIIFILSVAILFVIIWLFEQSNKNTRLISIFSAKKVAESEVSIFYDKSPYYWPIWCASGLIIAVTILSLVYDRSSEETVDTVTLSRFPLYIENWVGERELIATEIKDKLGADATFMANYTQLSQSIPVNLYIAHYRSQRKGVSPHSPRVCIPGGGWQITSFKRTETQGHPANQVIIEKGQERQLVYYWFLNGEQVIANEYVNKWYLFQNAIWHNRTDGSLIRYVTPIMANESLEEADKRIQSLIQRTDKMLSQYLI